MKFLMIQNILILKMGNCQKQENEDDGINNGNGPVNEIRICNMVWNKDYQGLFDYDSKAIDKKVVKIKGDAIIIKNGNKFQLADDNLNELNEVQLKNSLFRIVAKPNYYQIHPIYIEGETYTLQKILWLVVSSLPNKSHEIQQRDILKLGKQKIRVREIVYSDSNNNSSENVKLSKTVYEDLTHKTNLPKSQIIPEEQVKQNQSAATNSDQVCRICLQIGQYDNPLITPCKCSGSVKYIHLNCLKNWLGKRLNAIKNPYCITINWLPLSCEMCMAPFRYRIYLDNKKFYTVDIPKPPKPYIIIELMRKQTSSKGKVFHFISFAQKQKIHLGRRKDIDVKVSDDISISRSHATIQYNSTTKSFTLCDNKSKFGTLVLVKKGIIARPKFPSISAQIGAEVFSFDALRGEGRQNFQPVDGNGGEYLVQDEIGQDQNTNESDGGQSEASQENDQEIEEASSPQLRHRPSLASEPH